MPHVKFPLTHPPCHCRRNKYNTVPISSTAFLSARRMLQAHCHTYNIWVRYHHHHILSLIHLQIFRQNQLMNWYAEFWVVSMTIAVNLKASVVPLCTRHTLLALLFVVGGKRLMSSAACIEEENLPQLLDIPLGIYFGVYAQILPT